MTNTATAQQMRRIDEQLTRNRQQIAVLQLENVRLEEARLVLLGLAEQDAIAAGKLGMAGLQIRVGPPVHEHLSLDHRLDDARAESKRQRDRDAYARGKAKAAERFGVPLDQLIRSHGVWKVRERAKRSDADVARPSAKQAMAERVRSWLTGRVEPVASGDAVDALGARGDPRKTQQVYQAFYDMMKLGEIVRDPEGRYLAKPLPNGSGAHA